MDRSRSIANSMVYNPFVVADPRVLDGYREASRNVRLIIRDYLSTKKIIGSYSVAKELILSCPYRDAQGNLVVLTEQDIQQAYDLVAGNGFEYEWPYE